MGPPKKPEAFERFFEMPCIERCIKRLGFTGLPGCSYFFVFVFIDPSCPISQKYIPAINLLVEAYDLSVYGVQPNLGIDNAEIIKFKEEYEFRFPVINDTAQKLTYYLNASVTPEVFLLDNSGNIIYSGAIDNWFFDLGRYRKEATIHYLKEALDSNYGTLFSVNNKTKAIGCLIQRE